ncbi:S41 family peptidase [Sphingomonas sp.]|uniref:S41 family peptidase n=1 Tax=Sphingomonas sp. TaxID=28214 RepID=UPI0033420C2F
MVSPMIVAAQEAPPADRATTNLRDFDFVVDKITANYAGWDTKVTPATRAQLAALTAQLRAKAATASDAELTALLVEWVDFFKDRHIRVFAQPAPSAPASAAVVTQNYPSRPLTEAQARARFAALGKTRDPIEGIWRIGGDRYRVAILRDPGNARVFTAAVLTTMAGNWHPGQIKAEITRDAAGALQMLYRTGAHGEEKVGAELVAAGAAIAVTGWGTWARELPVVADADIVARQFPSDDLFLKALSPKTLWLRIPDFDPSRAAPLKALLAAHKAQIDKTPNLVIDLRGNGGGSDFVCEPLLPLVYTRPVYTIGIEMRASQDNIALRRKVADDIRVEAPDVAANLDIPNKQMAGNFGGYFRPDPLPFSIDRLPTVVPYPKRVAVLVDGAGSTAEQFLLALRQSGKVTLMGQSNSAGVLDFANVVGMPTPSGRFRLQWATSRTLRLPGDRVDPDGIAPDIRIPTGEKDPITHAAKWLERQVD